MFKVLILSVVALGLVLTAIAMVLLFLFFAGAVIDSWIYARQFRRRLGE